jgi:hypothetical protein
MVNAQAPSVRTGPSAAACTLSILLQHLIGLSISSGGSTSSRAINVRNGNFHLARHRRSLLRMSLVKREHISFV